MKTLNNIEIELKLSENINFEKVMSVPSSSELLTEAAGVKIYMTKDRATINTTLTGKICVTLENIKKAKALGKYCGFHLTRSKWDPYPWISHIEVGSLADIAGLR